MISGEKLRCSLGPQVSWAGGTWKCALPIGELGEVVLYDSVGIETSRSVSLLTYIQSIQSVSPRKPSQQRLDVWESHPHWPPGEAGEHHRVHCGGLACSALDHPLSYQ